MGLAMVYGIVKNHGGTIRVYSETGQGATFRVYLPLETKAPANAGYDKADKPVRRTGCILLVDDEAVVRNVASRMLRRLGYEVVTAASGKEAIACFREHMGWVDLVIIDMVMPEMSGRDCFRALKEIDPEVRAVLSTGYGLNGRAQEIIDEGMVGFVQKPYDMEALAERIGRAMGR